MGLYKQIMKAEREAYRKGMKIYGIYMKLTPRNKDIADKILDSMIEGKITYEEALRRIRELYKKQTKRSKNTKKKH